jgi:hypothetical protein
VCGYALDSLPWDGEISSLEICPCCGIQFGYHDAAGDGPGGRRTIYQELRNKWVAADHPWSSKSQPPPADWDPREQLRRVYWQ